MNMDMLELRIAKFESLIDNRTSSIQDAQSMIDLLDTQEFGYQEGDSTDVPKTQHYRYPESVDGYFHQDLVFTTFPATVETLSQTKPQLLSTKSDASGLTQSPKPSTSMDNKMPEQLEMVLHLLRSSSAHAERPNPQADVDIESRHGEEPTNKACGRCEAFETLASEDRPQMANMESGESSGSKPSCHQIFMALRWWGEKSRKSRLLQNQLTEVMRALQESEHQITSLLSQEQCHQGQIEILERRVGEDNSGMLRSK
ncbi:hypothetical protein QBC41DRAFT_300498 [Cercophora samala]|uniref:Uncharacterized protein n=1 Tax=Cercophora samala TaxID=330535 RepID=A0AA39ZIX5_9PEZI|nr:hypothetical protein QBC41DRAFT_300498 [Cercophora samala]